MQIKEKTLPEGSLIDIPAIGFDYTDCFSGIITSKEPANLEACVRCLFNRIPAWINILVKIRSVLVWPFGLKSDSGQFPPVISISKNSKVLIFDVLDLTDDEILLYITDNHLNAWLSIILRGLPGRQEVIITTAVKYNNMLGRIYFLIIKPFHKLIIADMLRRLDNNLNLKRI